MFVVCLEQELDVLRDKECLLNTITPCFQYRWVFSVVSGTMRANTILEKFWDCTEYGFCLKMNSRSISVPLRKLPKFLQDHPAVTVISTLGNEGEDQDQEQDQGRQHEAFLPEDKAGETGQVWRKCRVHKVCLLH